MLQLELVVIRRRLVRKIRIVHLWHLQGHTGWRKAEHIQILLDSAYRPVVRDADVERAALGIHERRHGLGNRPHLREAGVVFGRRIERRSLELDLLPLGNVNLRWLAYGDVHLTCSFDCVSIFCLIDTKAGPGEFSVPMTM